MTRFVKLISNDDRQFTLPLISARRSVTISNLLEDLDSDENEIPINIDGETLEKVVEYLNLGINQDAHAFWYPKVKWNPHNTPDDPEPIKTEIKTKNLSEEVLLDMVKNNGLVIEYIRKPSEDVQLAAVKQNKRAIRYIQNPSQTVQLASVQQNGMSLRYFRTSDQEVLLEAVRQNWLAIQFMDNPDEEVQLEAVKRSKGEAIKYIEFPTETVQFEAVKLWENSINYISKLVGKAKQFEQENIEKFIEKTKGLTPQERQDLAIEMDKTQIQKLQNEFLECIDFKNNLEKSRQLLYNLIMAGNSLEIKSLLRCAVQKTKSIMIELNDSEKIHKAFDTRPMTIEEEEEARFENGYEIQLRNIPWGKTEAEVRKLFNLDYRESIGRPFVFTPEMRARFWVPPSEAKSETEEDSDSETVSETLVSDFK